SDLYVASNGRAFALAPDTTTLYDVTASPFAAVTDAPSLGLARAFVENVTAVAISDEAPSAHWLFLFVVNGPSRTDVIRMDLTTNTNSLQILSSFPGGFMQFASVPAQSGAAQFITFNDGQNVANGATSKPLVARVLNASGLPVFGQPATFST